MAKQIKKEMLYQTGDKKKQKLAAEVIERLRREYPDAACTLDYDNAWKLLVGVRLAAQCTDERVNVVVEELYAKYPTMEALAAAEVEEIEAIVRPCGPVSYTHLDVYKRQRPYVGRKKGEFKRTSNRHDYALKPYGRTALNALKDAGYDVISVGKIFDIFDGEGLTESNKSKSSVHGMEQTIEIADREFTGLCFTNLVDFDALWGHRRNVAGYAHELEKFDEKLGILMEKLREDDLLIITADHGNDPTHTGTDHTREQVPFLLYSCLLYTSRRISL